MQVVIVSGYGKLQRLIRSDKSGLGIASTQSDTAFRDSKSQIVRQNNIPTAALLPRIRVNNGKATVLSIVALKTVVIGAARSMANGGRQSCFGLDRISELNSPSQGAIRNQLASSGKKVVVIRGRKDKFVSPWEAKPMIVMTPRIMTSPSMRAQFSLPIDLESIPF
jgi:hypothetical protein